MVELRAGAQQQAMGNGEIRDKRGKDAWQLYNLLTHSLQRLRTEQGVVFLPWELEIGFGRMRTSTVTV